jgi:hypothetical protein
MKMTKGGIECVRGKEVGSRTENMKDNETVECGGSGGGKKKRIVCHDSSIRTSVVRERERGVRACACALVRVCLIGPPSSRATISLPSACARIYNASRAPSSVVRFARERRASASCPREKDEFE